MFWVMLIGVGTGYLTSWIAGHGKNRTTKFFSGLVLFPIFLIIAHILVVFLLEDGAVLQWNIRKEVGFTEPLDRFLADKHVQWFGALFGYLVGGMLIRLGIVQRKKQFASKKESRAQPTLDIPSAAPMLPHKHEDQQSKNIDTSDRHEKSEMNSLTIFGVSLLLFATTIAAGYQIGISKRNVENFDWKELSIPPISMGSGVSPCS